MVAERAGAGEPRGPGRELVRRALDVLKPYLDTFVRQRIDGRAEIRLPKSPDIAALLKALIEHWERAFAGVLSPSVRNYAHLLKDVRNRWAHEAEFSDREARHAVDTVWLVASAIGTPSSALGALDELNANGSSRPGSALTADDSVRRIAPGVGPSRARARIQRDADGVIMNAEELTADDVVMQRVLCPACKRKVFEEWSAGWDAHAGSPTACRGITAVGEEARKGEFRNRFGHLFRKGRESQRSVMRRIWARCRCDEACVVREYAAAERRGEVARASNAHHLAPEAYAATLLQDGLRKGWLRPCPTR